MSDTSRQDAVQISLTRKECTRCRAEEKVAILRRHLLDKVRVSDLFAELDLHPIVFYRWQKEFFENGAAAFLSRERPGRQEDKQKRIEFLELPGGMIYCADSTHRILGPELPPAVVLHLDARGADLRSRSSCLICCSINCESANAIFTS
jgi:transposase-like protein